LRVQEVFMLFALLSFAFAQSDEPATPAPLPVQYKDVTEVDFEGQKVNGELYGPSIQLVPERRAGQFNSLIVLRASFDDEMVRSTGEVR
jgi:hypothetical protein